MQWYISFQGEVTGPYDAAQVRQDIEMGRVPRGTFVRDESGAWAPIESSPFGPVLQRRIDQQTVKKKPWEPSGWVMLLLGIVGVVVFVKVALWAMTSGNSSPPVDPIRQAEEREDREMSMAMSMSKQFLEDMLKSPGTADYGSPWKGTYQKPTEHCKVVKTGRVYRCRGWVDSQNGFGAIVRTNWDLTIEDQKNGNWSLVKVNSLREIE